MLYNFFVLQLTVLCACTRSMSVSIDNRLCVSVQSKLIIV